MQVELPDLALYVLNKLHNAGFSAYLVGGCVRDYLLGRSPNDWDVATSALPDDVIAVFDEDSVIETGIQHGTVTLYKEKQMVEITTYRKEGRYKDHRRPEAVEFIGKIEEDLGRRDFTINAMAYAPNEGLIDPFGGVKDLRQGMIRAVGRAEERFEEDALRIMRCIRFAAAFDFSVAQSTAEALVEKSSLLYKIASERIYTELKKTVMSPAAGRVLSQFSPVFEELFPKGKCCDFHYMDDLEMDVFLRMSAFFCGLYKDADRVACTRSALSFLKAENAMKKQILPLADALDRPIPENLYGIRKRISELGRVQFLRVLALKEALNNEDVQSARQYERQIMNEHLCCSLNDLALNGHDLMAEGLRNERIGAVLKQLLDAVMRQQVCNEREELLSYFNQHKKYWII